LVLSDADPGVLSRCSIGTAWGQDEAQTKSPWGEKTLVHTRRRRLQQLAGSK